MEGKAALFATLVDINAVPILLDETDPAKCIEHVVAIASGFGAIQIEDIAAPALFRDRGRAARRLDKPVMHDDQHCTAVVVLAATFNAMRRAGMDLADSVIGEVGGSARRASGSAAARRCTQASGTCSAPTSTRRPPALRGDGRRTGVAGRHHERCGHRHRDDRRARPYQARHGPQGPDHHGAVESGPGNRTRSRASERCGDSRPTARASTTCWHFRDCSKARWRRTRRASPTRCCWLRQRASPTGLGRRPRCPTLLEPLMYTTGCDCRRSRRLRAGGGGGGDFGGVFPFLIFLLRERASSQCGPQAKGCVPFQAVIAERSFFSALASIWRMRSADTPYSSASSCSVRLRLRASQRRLTMSRERASSVPRPSRSVRRLRSLHSRFAGSAPDRRRSAGRYAAGDGGRPRRRRRRRIEADVAAGQARLHLQHFALGLTPSSAATARGLLARSSSPGASSLAQVEEQLALRLGRRDLTMRQFLRMYSCISARIQCTRTTPAARPCPGRSA